MAPSAQRRACLAVLVHLLVAAPAAAAEVAVTAAWARATPAAARTGAAYLTLHNTGAADRLLGAEAAVAERVEVHTHRMDGGVARMERVEAVPLAAGAVVPFAPGGLHVMLIGLMAPLQAGASFPLTLVFERAGRVGVTVAVRALRDGPPPASTGALGH